MISSNIYGYKAHDRMTEKPKYPEDNLIHFDISFDNYHSTNAIENQHKELSLPAIFSDKIFNYSTGEIRYGLSKTSVINYSNLASFDYEFNFNKIIDPNNITDILIYNKNGPPLIKINFKFYRK